MGVVRRVLPLLLVAFVVSGGGATAALTCADGESCPMTAASGGGHCATSGSVHATMPCCESQAAAPLPAAGAALPSPSAPSLPPLLLGAMTLLLFVVAPRRVAGLGERSRAERRHALGLYTLHSLFRI